MARSTASRKVAAPAPVEAKAFVTPTVHRVDVVGCGGTGAIVAEQIARWIAGLRLPVALRLWDGDVVEGANVVRQAFYPWEIGSNKAEALAIRLASQFGLPIETRGRFGAGVQSHDLGQLVITCTDTLMSRKRVSSLFAAHSRGKLWLDVGNELTTGQAVLGTTHHRPRLGKAWREWATPYAEELPTIAAITPSLLRVRAERRTPGCAERPFAHQGPATNLGAAIAAAMIARQVLVDGLVTTAQVWFDVAAGRMLPVPITRGLFEPWKKARARKGQKA